MSTAYTKQKLKQSRDAIAQKDWDTAVQAARDVLEHEATNYNANVFLGLALLNLERYDESQKAYTQATHDQPTQLLAWQGLERFYTQTRKWDNLRDVLLHLLDIHNDAGDATKAAEAWQKLVSLEREEGGKRSLVAALELILPESRYYSTLSSLEPPDQTQPEKTSTFDAQMAVHVNSLDVLLEIVGLTERLEADVVEKETEKRRMRLDGARKGKEALRNEVIVEVYADSRLPAYYDQVLSHPNAADELRRETESKLLRRQLLLLRAYPSTATGSKLAGPSGTAAFSAKDAAEQQQRDDALRTRKEELRDRVVKMAEGMVIIGLDDEQAWDIVLEWSDTPSLADLPFDRLRHFIALFPRSGRAKSFQALLLLLQDEQFLAEREEMEKRHDVEVDRSRDADLLGLAIEGLEESSSSLLASRIAAVLYLLDRDFASAAEVATGSLGLARRTEADASLTLTECKYDISSLLLTALTHHHPPQNHAKAIRLADSILSHDEANVDALLARSYVDQAAGRWEEARAHLQTVHQLSSGGGEGSQRSTRQRQLSISPDPALEAWIETAWCDVNLGRLEEARAEMDDILARVDPLTFSGVTSEDRAKIWWRLGQCLWRMGGPRRNDPEHAFTCFITSLKRNPSFAPSYTSLGIFYEEIAQPPDAVRASKCFQKAFELDARENEAARRLAEGFAEEREWDLVEVVARRTIEGEGGAEALDAGASSTTSGSSSAAIAASRRHLSHNSWAWKAVGSVEVSRKAYEKAILAFQIALRSQPEDAGAWLRLGEAYAAAGRHVAALKCFDKCLELLGARQQSRSDDESSDEDDGWQARYCIGDVQRQLGNFELSIDIFSVIMQAHQKELGVRVALADTLLMQARKEFHAGYVERSEGSARRAIRQAGQVLLEDNEHLRSAWKIVADATFHLSRFGRVVDPQRLLFDNEGEDSGRMEAILDLATKLGTDAKLPSISAVTRKEVDDGLASLLSEADEEGASPAAVSHSDILLRASVFLYKLRVVLNANDSVAAGGAWADLAVSLYRLARSTSSSSSSPAAQTAATTLTRQAIGSIKEALRSEPANESFWLILGNLTFVQSVKLAQHAYVRAIESAPKSSIPWSNLGFLYLHHGDVLLANEAFIKAQTADPDAAEAWVGQALVASHHGDERARRVLFDHAVKLSQGALLEADYGFGEAVFSSLSSSPAGAVDMHAPSHALSTYLSHSPLSIDALHLSALFCERLGQMSLAIERIERAATLLEGEYESTEAAATARRYAVAEVNLGRIRLAKGDVEGAKEAFEAALGLLDADAGDADEEDGDDGVVDASHLKRARVNASLGLALSLFQGGDEASALSTLLELLDTIPSLSLPTPIEEACTTSVTVHLARLLFASSDVEGAKTHLLSCIGRYPSSLPVITTLSALGIVQDDGDLTSAALGELSDLTADSTGAAASAVVREDRERRIPLLLCLSALREGREEDALAILSREEGIEARLELAETLVRMNRIREAERIVAECRTRLYDDLNPTAPSSGGETQRWRARAYRDSAVVASLVASLGGDDSGVEEEKATAVEQEPEGDEREGDGAATAMTTTTTTKMVQREEGKNLSPSGFASLAVLAAPWEAANWAVLHSVSSAAASG